MGSWAKDIQLWIVGFGSLALDLWLGAFGLGENWHRESFGRFWGNPARQPIATALEQAGKEPSK